MEKNNIIKQHNERLRQEGDYGVTRPSRLADYATIQPVNEFSKLNFNDGHSTDSSIGDRINQLGSEDELSNGSGNMSPRTRRAVKHINSTNYSVRNQSPRSLNGEAKLRPGVTARSSNRNSANLSTNFQEELLRLINPDNIEPPVEQKLSKEIKSHSRDGLNNLSVHKLSSDASLRQMTNSCNTISSSLSNDLRRSQDEIITHVTPSKLKAGGGFPDDFPLPEDSDWPSLVDTATSFMNQVGSKSEGGKELEGARHWNEDIPNRHWNEDIPVDASLASS